MLILQRFRHRSFGSLRARGAVLCGAVLCFSLCFSASGFGQTGTATTLTITANGGPLPGVLGSGVAVTLTATVTSGGAAVMPAEADFCDAAPPNCTGVHLLGIAQMTHAGTAITKLVPGPGTHNVQAFFPGTHGNPASSSGIVPLVVGPFDPVTIQFGAGPGDYTLSAFVAGGSTVFPTGTITFIDTSNANYVLGTASLRPGMGTFGGDLLITQAVAAFPDACSCLPIGIAAVDFNGDGILDVAMGDGALNILLGHGDLTFSELPTQPIGGPWVTSIAVGDFNQDGKMDLVASQFPDGVNAYTYVLLGNGDGTFTEPQTINGLGQPNLTVADLNGDGIPDLVLSAGGTLALGVTIMLGNGDGTFTTKSSFATGATGMPIVGDFNGDGKVDLALAAAGGKTVVYLGNGDGTFTASSLSAPTSTALLPGQGDFLGDGFLETAGADFLGPPSGPEMILEFLRTVPITQTSFAPGVPGIFIVGTGPHLIAARYGGDSVYGPSVSPPIALTALPEPTTLSLTANPASFNQFQPAVLTATLAPDMAQNHNATGTVTFMSGTTVVGTAAVTNGVATLSTTKFPAGNGNVIAAYAGDTNFAASTSSAVSVVVAPVDFSLSLESGSLTIETQHHLTTSAALTSINGFADSITLACPKPPKNITCQFTPSPATLAGNGTATVSFYLDTDSIEGFARNSAPAGPIVLACSLFVGIAGLGRRGIRPRVLVVVLAVVAISATLGLSGCGDIIIPPPSVLPGTYTIPVTATAAATGVSHTENLTLTVTR